MREASRKAGLDFVVYGCCCIWQDSQKHIWKYLKIILTAFAVILSGAAFYFLRSPPYRLFGEIAFPGKEVKAKDFSHEKAGKMMAAADWYIYIYLCRHSGSRISILR